MKRKFSEIWLILVAAMLFGIASLMTVAVADEPETNAVSEGNEVGPDTLTFIAPYQYTSKDVSGYKPPPVSTFNVGDPLWMNLFINVDGPKKVTGVYALINKATGAKKIYKSTFNLSQGGNWRISRGWPNGVSAELKGTWILYGIVVSGSEKATCPKPWKFTVN